MPMCDHTHCLSYEEKMEKFFTTHHPIPSKCIILTVDKSAVEYRNDTLDESNTVSNKSVSVNTATTTEYTPPSYDQYDEYT